jgi:hypothetical protein
VENRRLANAMQADMSGWEPTQFLRVPNTRNYRYGVRPPVEVVSVDGNAKYYPDELD